MEEGTDGRPLSLARSKEGEHNTHITMDLNRNLWMCCEGFVKERRTTNAEVLELVSFNVWVFQALPAWAKNAITVLYIKNKNDIDRPVTYHAAPTISKSSKTR